MKKIIISGGGTGGHIFPAISIANALKRLDKSVEILFVGAEGKMEMERVPEAGYPIIGLPIRGFKRKLSFDNIAVLFNLMKSLRRAKKIIRTFKPDVVVGVGGYASGPIGKVASRMGIPLVLQEQNSYAGVTNRLLGSKAAKVCVAYEGMERFFSKEKIVFTGNPVRRELLGALNAREEGALFYGLDPNKKIVFITGGSLGAGNINKAVAEIVKSAKEWKDIQFLWQCGSYYYPDIKRDWEGKLPESVKLLAFVKRMDLAYGCADIVISRAGAGTISELSLLGKVAILVPSPNVAEDHQTKNALSLVNRGAAVMVKDSEVIEQLGDVLADLLKDDKKMELLKEHILPLGVSNSDEIIARIVLER